MTRIAKLYSQLRTQNRTLKFSELQSLMRAAGFVLVRTRGSHESYRHPRVPQVLTIQPHKNMAQGYQVREFLAKVDAFDLWNDDQ